MINFINFHENHHQHVMRNVAYIFPGQGSQTVGMGADLAETFISSSSIFCRANEALDFDLRKICFEGPAEELKKTATTQPAILAVSMAAFLVLKEKNKLPKFVAGHSLGEYSALCAAGVMRFEDALRLVRLRGQFMQEAVPEGEGMMAAVLGLDAEKIEGACKLASRFGAVSVANYNSPTQIVISGKKEAVLEAQKLCREFGAKRTIPLEVSAPFHCELMLPAAQRMEPELEKIKFEDAKIPIVSNVAADFEHRADEIKKLLVKQITHPVRWVESVNKMIESGIDTFVEIGPGKVLSGLVKKINPSVKAISVENAAGIEEVLNL